MLSRVAQRVYWIGRYIERSENVARFVNVNSNLLFDLPSGTRLGWEILIEILGSQEDYKARYKHADERSVMKYLLSDRSNPSSLVSTVYSVRENMRTTREILPADAWEQINDLYYSIKNGIADGLGRKKRYNLLQDVIATSQQLTGMISSTMSNNHAYEFIRTGRNLERADMTTRILDMGCNNLLPQLFEDKEHSDTVLQYQPILWMNILVSLSAYQSYRQNLQSRVIDKDVIAFLIKDTDFPRSLMHCLNQIIICLDKLPKGNSVIDSVEVIKKKVNKKNLNSLPDSGLNKYFDQIQIDLADLSDQIEAKWFLN